MRPSVHVLAAAAVLRVSSAVTSWYVSSMEQDSDFCRGMLQADGTILPMHSVGTLNQYAAFGLYEPCSPENLSPEASSCPPSPPRRSVVALRTLDESGVPRWSCKDSAVDVADPSSAVVLIEPTLMCPDTMVCVIGGSGRASVDCTTTWGGGPSRWSSQPPVPDGLSYATALFMWSHQAGRVGSVFIFGGRRKDGINPEGTVYYSEVDPGTCQLGEWQALVTAAPYGERRGMFGTVAHVQQGLYIGGGRDVGSAGETRKEWYSDLFFLPFSAFMDASGAIQPIGNASLALSAWRTVTVDLPSPYVVDMRGDPPRMVVEVAVTFQGFNMMGITPLTNVTDFYQQWQLLADPDAEVSPTHTPGLLFLLGRDLYFAKSFDERQFPMIAGDDRYILKNIVYPNPPPWASADKRVPSLRAPAAMMDTLQGHQQAMVIGAFPTLTAQSGSLSFLSGYAERACIDFCPKRFGMKQFSYGCRAHPWDLPCIECKVCRNPVEYVEQPCTTSWSEGYQDTVCKDCEACPEGFIVEFACNATQATTCIKEGGGAPGPIPPGPDRMLKPVMDNNVEEPLVIALSLACGAFSMTCLSMLTVLACERSRTLSSVLHAGNGTTEKGVNGAAKVAFRAFARWILLCLGACQFWSMVLACAAVTRTYASQTWGVVLVCIQVVSVCLSCALASAHMGHEYILPVHRCGRWATTLLRGLLVPPRALLLLGYSSKQTARIIPVPMNVASGATWAAVAATLYGDFLPSIILLQFVNSRDLNKLRVPLVWLSSVCLLLGMCTLLVCSHKLARYKLLESVARPKEVSGAGPTGQDSVVTMSESRGQAVVMSPLMSVEAFPLQAPAQAISVAEQAAGRQIRVQHILQQHTVEASHDLTAAPACSDRASSARESGKVESVYGGYAPGVLPGLGGEREAYPESLLEDEDGSEGADGHGRDLRQRDQGSSLAELLQAVTGFPLPAGAPVTPLDMADMLQHAGEKLIAAAQQISKDAADGSTGRELPAASSQAWPCR